MITIVTGKIGGGKTYWAVNYLVGKFFIYKDDLFQFVPRTDVVVITNIRDLDVEHRNLDEEISKLGIEGVFSQSYVSGKSVVFVIDEAQKYFDRKFYNKNVFSFFQMSRHYGSDIVLITQDVETLSKELRNLYEYEIQAVARSQRLKNTFMYKYISHDEVFKRQNIKFDKKVGNLYRSQFRNETEHVPRVWGKFLIIGLVCCAVALFGVTRLINIFKTDGEIVMKKEKVVKSREMLPNEIEDFKKELSIISEAKAETEVKNKPGVSRLWGGSDTLEAVYDVDKDSSYYILKEDGKMVGYVKTEGSPVHIAGLDCKAAKVACRGADKGSLVASFCQSCGINLPDSAQASTLTSASKGGVEQKKNFNMFEPKPKEKASSNRSPEKGVQNLPR